jgi:hypothetical protein
VPTLPGAELHQRRWRLPVLGQQLRDQPSGACLLLHIGAAPRLARLRGRSLHGAAAAA